MITAGMNITDAELTSWVASLIWPFMRVGAMFAADGPQDPPQVYWPIMDIRAIMSIVYPTWYTG